MGDMVVSKLVGNTIVIGTIDDNVTFDNSTPTIFLDETPSAIVHYYTGPWLPCAHAFELEKYSLSLKYPLQALENPITRNNIKKGLQILVKNKPKTLFDDSEDGLESALENLSSLNKKSLYSQWSINVKSKDRTISTPKKPLEFLLKEYVSQILEDMPLHEKSHGGNKGWSPKKSIYTHVPFRDVITFDVQRAFDNMDLQFVFEKYYTHAVSKMPAELARDVAGFLTHVSTVYIPSIHQAGLPVGSPTSMALFNRILYPIDKYFNKMSKKNRLNYSRWVDDMILTGQLRKNSYGTMVDVIRRVREDFPFPIHNVFYQKKEPFYILGNEVKNNIVTEAKDSTAKNSRIEVDEYHYLTERESDFGPDFNESDSHPF